MSTIFCVVLGPLLSWAVISSQAAFVDPQYKLVEWEGWGTSLTWFGDVIGGLSQPVQDEIIEALFSPDKLNLNIVRYVIGGTTPGTNCSEFRDGAVTESFRDSLETLYRWERDSRTRKILLAAKARGADTFEALSRSPPSWLTKSGCTNGNSEGASVQENFDTKNANSFADYLTEVVKYYNDQHNISFSYLSPFTEPLATYANGVDYPAEGCHMEVTTIAHVIKSVYASLQAKNLTFCKAAVADGRPDIEINTQKYLLNENLSRYYDKVNVKGYPHTNKIAELFSMANKNSQKLWTVVGTSPKSSLQNMTQGLNIAEMIRWGIRDMISSAWIYFQAVEDQATGYQMHGLLDVPYNNDSVANIKINSGYYTMMQFSKYINKGYTIVHTNDWDTVAAFNDKTETLVLVSTNAETMTATKTFDLRAFLSVGQILTFRTSSTEPHVPVFPPEINELQFTFDLPSRSVTTFQILNAVPQLTDNFIRNGNFESTLSNPWQLLFGIREDNGVNGKYAFRGMKSGYLSLEESKLSLVQNVTVMQTKSYYLSAWCATDGPNTLLGVLINGYQGPEISINSDKGYQLYGLTVEAERNDVLSVYIHAEKGTYTAQIDDVVLH